MLVGPAKSKLVFEPLGVIGIMGSWNFPLLTCLSPLIYAIAAGNTAVIKPSEVSPNSLLILKKLCEAYLDRDSYIMIEG
jgi:aldehyde dehydrogenase (NAD+)